MTPFERKVLTIVSRIPVGRVTTYGDIARLAGKPGAARAVGNIMRRGDRPGLPYHRVIAAGGGLGGYSSLHLKGSLLSAEGVTVTPRRVVGFASIRWPGAPLEAKAGEVSSKRRKLTRGGAKSK
jgi:O-6-methylguanine DNA methyltransferase